MRRERILQLLEDREYLDVREIQEMLKVSLSTVHRDLDVLEREGRIRKQYGKVFRISAPEYEPLFSKRLKNNVAQKQAIARKALELVSDGDCLFLDHSTTVYYFAKELASSDFRGILIVTNAPAVSQLFLDNKGIEVILTGGYLHKDLNALFGGQAVSTISGFNADKFFLSSLSVSIEDGVTDGYEPGMIEVKRAMMSHSKQGILLLDSSKFNRKSPYTWFTLDQIAVIVTNRFCPDSTVENLEACGLRVLLA